MGVGLLFLWGTINVLLILFVALRFGVQKQYLIECDATTNKLCSVTKRSAMFNALWTLLLTFAVSVFGFLVLRSKRSSMSVGIFIGFSIALANWFLCITVDYANIVHEKMDAVNAVEGDIDFRLIIEAAAATAAILTLLFTMMSALLVYFGSDLVRGPVSKDI